MITIGHRFSRNSYCFLELSLWNKTYYYKNFLRVGRSKHVRVLFKLSIWLRMQIQTFYIRMVELMSSYPFEQFLIKTLNNTSPLRGTVLIMRKSWQAGWKKKRDDSTEGTLGRNERVHSYSDLHVLQSHVVNYDFSSCDRGATELMYKHIPNTHSIRILPIF